jgi:hypothetical protein
MKRSEGSRAHRLDRLAQELTHLSHRSLRRWHRFTYRLADGRARRADNWIRFSHRVRTGWRRLAQAYRDQWYRLSDRVAAGGRKRADPFRFLWGRFSDRVVAGRSRFADWRYELDNGWGFHPILGGILGGVVVISALVLIRTGSDTAVSGDASVAPPRTAVASTTEPVRRGLHVENDGVPGYEVHVNEGGGYLFSYPDTWEITSTGDRTRLISPDDEVIITFGTGPSGSLEETSDRVLENVTRSYSAVELVAPEIERTPQGFRSVVAGGDALEATGARVRFLSITIQGPDENRAIIVRFAPSADPIEALPAIQEIVSSFRISQVQSV